MDQAPRHPLCHRGRRFHRDGAPPSATSVASIMLKLSLSNIRTELSDPAIIVLDRLVNRLPVTELPARQTTARPLSQAPACAITISADTLDSHRRRHGSTEAGAIPATAIIDHAGDSARSGYGLRNDGIIGIFRIRTCDRHAPNVVTRNHCAHRPSSDHCRQPTAVIVIRHQDRAPERATERGPHSLDREYPRATLARRGSLSIRADDDGWSHRSTGGQSLQCRSTD